MKPHRIRAIILRHTYEVCHNANHITYMVYWPIVNISVWGFFTLYLGHADRLRPGVLSCLLGAVILWGLFNAFQRDMAVGFLEELWSRNLVSLFASPLSVSEYVTGLIIVSLAKAIIGLSVEALIAWAFYHYNIFSRVAHVDSVHSKLNPLCADARHHSHRFDLPVHDEISGYGLELCRRHDAALVRILPFKFIAYLSATDGLDTPNHAFVRRYERNYSRRKILYPAFQMGL